MPTRRPRGDRPTNIILPLSKLQLNPNPVNLVNPVKKKQFVAVLHFSTSTRLKTITIRRSSAHIRTNPFVEICDDLWTYHAPCHQSHFPFFAPKADDLISIEMLLSLMGD